MTEYRLEVKEYRKACLKAKQTDWRQGVEKQTSLESINKLRKIQEFNNKQTLGVLLKDDGNYTEPGQDTLDFLLKTHFPAITETQPTQYTEMQIPTNTIYETHIPWLTEDRIALLFIIVYCYKRASAKAEGDETKENVFSQGPRGKPPRHYTILAPSTRSRYTRNIWPEPLMGCLWG